MKTGPFKFPFHEKISNDLDDVINIPEQLFTIKEPAFERTFYWHLCRFVIGHICRTIQSVLRWILFCSPHWYEAFWEVKKERSTHKAIGTATPGISFMDLGILLDVWFQIFDSKVPALLVDMVGNGLYISLQDEVLKYGKRSNHWHSIITFCCIAGFRTRSNTLTTQK